MAGGVPVVLPPQGEHLRAHHFATLLEADQHGSAAAVENLAEAMEQLRDEKTSASVNLPRLQDPTQASISTCVAIVTGEDKD